ncbi:MAG: hypothetical protein GX594_14780 [Pirellulaceae bacterium]|nr:hypothetical protein [Pirellulaceae bacterium]
MRNGSTIAEMLVVLCVVMLGLVMVSPAGGPSATTCTAAAAEPSEPAAKQPRPAGDALAAADKSVRELFADRLERARLPADRAKLACELLEIAQAPADSIAAERYALLLLARETAVEGRDRAAAFAASRLIAEGYMPAAADTADEQFDAAQELWRLAERIRDAGQQLKLQAAAAELYYYALPGLDGLKKVIAEKNVADEVKETRQTSKKRDAKDADLKLLLGTWVVKSSGGYAGRWTFHPDGRVVAERQTTGVWRYDADFVKVIWQSGAWETFARPINPNGTKGNGGTARAGNTLNAVKIADPESPDA